MDIIFVYRAAWKPGINKYIRLRESNRLRRYLFSVAKDFLVDLMVVRHTEQKLL